MNVENVDPTVLRRGVLLAVDRDDAKRVFAARGDEALRDCLSGFVDEPSVWRNESAVDCECHWDRLHQCLCKMKGETPLDQCILGGRPMYQGTEMTVSLVRPDLVPHLAAGLNDIDASVFRELDLTEQDTAGVHATFLRLRQLYRSAAEHRHAIVFAVEHSPH